MKMPPRRRRTSRRFVLEREGCEPLVRAAIKVPPFGGRKEVEMQVGIRLHDTKALPLPQRLAETRAQGFSCAHVALGKVIEDFPINNGTLTPGFAMYLRKLFAANDLDIAVLGCYLNLANPNQKQLEEAIATYKAQIRFASLLGAGVVGTETGTPNEQYAIDPNSRTEEALTTFTRNLDRVVEYAEHMGVIVAIEPVIRHIVYDVHRARKVLDAIQSPNLQIILDPVNLLDKTNIVGYHDVIKEAIDVLGEDVAVVHLKDFAIKDGEVEELAVGQGQMEYDELVRFMKYDKPYIHATLENTVPENAVAAREYIQKLWDEA